MAYCSTPAEGLQSNGCRATKYHILIIFMAEVEQLNYKGIGIGHSWKAGMLPDRKRWVLLPQTQRNHSECLTWWWFLRHHTHALLPKTPAWNRNWKSKLPPASVCFTAPAQIHRGQSQKLFDCKGKSYASVLFPTLWYQSRSTRKCCELVPNFTTHHLM